MTDRALQHYTAMAAEAQLSALWHDMTQSQKRTTALAMTAFGGVFVRLLGEAWDRAGELDSGRLAAAFPELVREYGPGSEAFTAL